MSKSSKILIILLTFLLVFVFPCFAKNKRENSLIELSPIIGGSPPNRKIFRIIDKQSDVICYIYEHWGGAGSGISCVPLKDTKLFSKKNFFFKKQKK